MANVIVDCAVYEDGLRLPGNMALENALEAARAHGGFVWIGLHEPTADEFASVAALLDLHPLAVEDAVHAQQRAKLELYGDSLFMVLKPARYVDADQVIDVEQLMVFVGDAFVVTVRHGSSSAPAEVRRALEADTDRLAWGPTSVLHAIADTVVDDYGVVLSSLDIDIDQVGRDVFTDPKPTHAQRIFNLKREVLDFRRAVEGLAGPLDELAAGVKPVDPRSANYFRDVHDHVLLVLEHLTSIDTLLDSALHAHVAQVGMRQNEDMRKISAWVAIVAVPTMVAGIYGMNFEHMPELDWELGYPLVLAVMASACYGLHRSFKRRGWL